MNHDILNLIKTEQNILQDTTKCSNMPQYKTIYNNTLENTIDI